MVSIHRPLGYGPSTLPLRHSATHCPNSSVSTNVHTLWLPGSTNLELCVVPWTNRGARDLLVDSDHQIIIPYHIERGNTSMDHFPLGWALTGVIRTTVHGKMHVIVLSCTEKHVCFHVISLFSAHFWPHWKSVHQQLSLRKFLRIKSESSVLELQCMYVLPVTYFVQ